MHQNGSVSNLEIQVFQTISILVPIHAPPHVWIVIVILL